MTHLWPEGAAVKVWADADGPRRLVWNETVHPVQAITNQWRLDQGWWRLRIWRDYFMIETSTGFRLEVYHDLITDKWYLQRWYD